MSVQQGTDLKSIMHSHSMFLDICTDPDLDGDSKLFAALVITLLHQRRVAGRREVSGRGMLAAIAQMSGHRDPNSWIRRVIQADIPRYEPPQRNDYDCLAPMIRREGICGKPAIVRGYERDPLTGYAVAYAFCSRHRNHADDWRIQQNNKRWAENGHPSPPPNAGGVLRRYFAGDWDALYTWAAPYLTPLEGAKQPALPKPNLSLIQGGSP